MSDFINGALELLGAFLIANNCRLLFLHKQVQGVSVMATAYFSIWGLWNLYFYPANSLFYSFVGAILLAMANVTWVGMALHYRWRKPTQNTEELIARDLPAFEVSSVGRRL
jgi:hypothetical protein